MSSADVVDPTGVRWSVRRRWYPWRRALSLRDVWSSAPSGTDTTAGVEAEAEDSSLPRNVLLKVSFLVLAALAWLGCGVAKVAFYAVVVALFLIGSVLELALELAVMPFVLLLRLLGQSRWPVEICCGGEHFVTRWARDFTAAGNIRDSVIAEIERGVLPAESPPGSRGDSKQEPVGRFED